MIIGLTGVARSGKDTVGSLLVEHHGFERRAFADRLRAVALGADPYVRLDGVSLGDLDAHAFERLSRIVEAVDWESAKNHTDVRRFLQRLGTEGVRDNLGTDTWVNAAMDDLDGDTNVVFTDVRFPNEATAIRDESGEVWRVVRPGYGPVNDHASDAGLAVEIGDRVVFNDGSLDELRRRVAEHMNDLESSHV